MENSLVPVWSEKSLANFLQSTFPLELAAILMEAVPIIHRSLLRLGSFPYQNDPEELLNQRVLRTAVILLSRFLADVDSAYFSNNEGRICFQSMASLASGEVVRDQSSREEADDHDLMAVISGMKNRRRHPDQPKVMIQGPKQPPPPQFPSSWSRDLDQFIPTDEFRSFLRLIVVLNLFSSGIEAKVFITSVPQTEKVTDCLLTAFQAGPNGISWDVFDQVMKNDMVRNTKYILLVSILTRVALLTLGPVSTPKSPGLSQASASGQKSFIIKQDAGIPQRVIYPICASRCAIFRLYLQPPNAQLTWDPITPLPSYRRCVC